MSKSQRLDLSNIDESHYEDKNAFMHIEGNMDGDNSKLLKENQRAR